MISENRWSMGQLLYTGLGTLLLLFIRKDKEWGGRRVRMKVRKMICKRDKKKDEYSKQ